MTAAGKSMLDLPEDLQDLDIRRLANGFVYFDVDGDLQLACLASEDHWNVDVISRLDDFIPETSTTEV